MGFEVLKVEIQADAPVYFGGQEIRGHVRAVASSQVSCREINVVMKGKAKVHWTETRNKQSHTYTGNEEYGQQQLVLWSGSSSSNKIQPGNHTFPFMFTLPERIPSSFESNNGKVYYQVKVTADIPMGIDYVERANFIVHQMYDLNLDEMCLRPLAVQVEGTAGCCCFKQGPIEFSMTAQRSGYVPGEKIYISGTIRNHTVSAIKYTEAKIVQCMLLRADYKNKEELTTVQRVYRPSIRAGGKDVWNRVPLTVPAVAPSLLRYCNIINITYQLQFLAKIGSCKTATTGTELIIGSVPLRGTLPFHAPSAETALGGGTYGQAMGPSPSMPSAPAAPYQFQDPPPPYPESEPPAYEDTKYSMRPRDDDDEGGFAPRPYEKSYGNF